MGSKSSPFIQSLVSAEIRRLVAGAIETGSTLPISTCAAAVLHNHPNSGLDRRELEDAIMMAAARAGVAVEIGRPRRPLDAGAALGPQV